MEQPSWFTSAPVELRESTAQQAVQEEPVELQLPAPEEPALAEVPMEAPLASTPTPRIPLQPTRSSPFASPPPLQLPPAPRSIPRSPSALEQASTILGALPSIRYVVYEGDQPKDVQREWATLYDYYVELFGIKTAVPSVKRLDQLIEQLSGSEAGTRLLEHQLINTLEQLSADLDIALEEANNWWARLWNKQVEDVESLTLTHSTVESALHRLCAGTNAESVPNACRVRKRP
jgi:hypothetical protein